MDVVECMEACQREQKTRKAKIKAEQQHDAGCLLIGQESENFFPDMRVRHGVHIRLIISQFDLKHLRVYVGSI